MNVNELQYIDLYLGYAMYLNKCIIIFLYFIYVFTNRLSAGFKVNE